MVAAGLALAGVALALAGCGGTASAVGGAGGGAGVGGEAGFVAGDGSIVLLDPAARAAAPEVTGTTLDGKPFALADHRGEVVALNVWASWCAPCRAEAPELQKAWESLQGKAVQLVGLDTRDSSTSAQAFVARYGITYPQVVDTDGRLQLAFRDSLPPQAIPSTVVVDKQGRVAARILGRTDESTLKGIVEKLLAEPAVSETGSAS